MRLAAAARLRVLRALAPPRFRSALDSPLMNMSAAMSQHACARAEVRGRDAARVLRTRSGSRAARGRAKTTFAFGSVKSQPMNSATSLFDQRSRSSIAALRAIIVAGIRPGARVGLRSGSA